MRDKVDQLHADIEAASPPSSTATAPPAHATELTLAAEAAERGWSREVERHAATARRIASLLNELHEPLICPDDSRSTGDGNPGLGNDSRDGPT
jgi:hypothetical protein